MNITRRIALKNFLIIAAGAAILPSCLTDDSPASISLRKIRITGLREKTLASLTETIIPATDTPGARDISAHLFVLKMVDDCYTTDEQATFIKGFDSFEDESEKRYQKSFDELDDSQKADFVTSLENSKEESSALVSFYRSVKGLTVLGYTTSQYYLTQVKGYNIIPGKYQGSVPLKTSTAPNA